MPVAHRQTPNRLRELRERVQQLVQARLAGVVICTRCRATLGTYADLCEADLDERCPGFNVVDRAQMDAAREVGLVR